MPQNRLARHPCQHNRLPIASAPDSHSGSTARMCGHHSMAAVWPRVQAGLELGVGNIPGGWDTLVVKQAVHLPDAPQKSRRLTCRPTWLAWLHPGGQQTAAGGHVPGRHHAGAAVLLPPARRSWCAPPSPAAPGRPPPAAAAHATHHPRSHSVAPHYIAWISRSTFSGMMNRNIWGATTRQQQVHTVEDACVTLLLMAILDSPC